MRHSVCCLCRVYPSALLRTTRHHRRTVCPLRSKSRVTRTSAWNWGRRCRCRGVLLVDLDQRQVLVFAQSATRCHPRRRLSNRMACSSSTHFVRPVTLLKAGRKMRRRGVRRDRTAHARRDRGRGDASCGLDPGAGCGALLGHCELPCSCSCRLHRRGRRGDGNPRCGRGGRGQLRTLSHRCRDGSLQLRAADGCPGDALRPIRRSCSRGCRHHTGCWRRTGCSRCNRLCSRHSRALHSLPEGLRRLRRGLHRGRRLGFGLGRGWWGRRWLCRCTTLQSVCDTRNVAKEEPRRRVPIDATTRLLPVVSVMFVHITNSL
eukprot:Hpha_TRINITY_DN35001_c0_g1::TRINITY_DN35001_c0_g1_i1::g.82737::m.82737